MKRSALAAAFLLFIALCVSLAYWGMQLFKPPARQVTAPPQMAHIDVSPEQAAGLFGGRPAQLAQAVNYQLKGVVVSGSGDDSVAILIPDGKPPKAVGVNSEVSPGVVVKEVHPRYVIVSEGGISKRIELPANAPSGASGIISPLGAGSGMQFGAQQGSVQQGRGPLVLGNDTPGTAVAQPQMQPQPQPEQPQPQPEQPQPEQPPPPPQAGDQPPPPAMQPSMMGGHPSGMMGMSMRRQ